MAAVPAFPRLAELPLEPYLTDDGDLSDALQRKIGIYAIFDAEERPQYIGYSRDVYQSFKQHLVRQPQACRGFKLQTIERPSRSVLESIKQAWMTECGLTLTPAVEAQWVAAIDAKSTMTADEAAEYAALSDGEKPKYLKKIARRLEAKVLSELEAHGVRMELRFNPKLKEEGLLDLK